MSPDPSPPDLPVPPVTGAVAANEIAAQAEEAAHGHGHHGPVHSHCKNCQAPLHGPYCHQCGQHDFDVHRSFGHVFHEALESFFHFDAKLFRNIITLLFQPGKLTAEFNAGKRASQMPPLRLYVFVSIFFFFVSFATSDKPAAAAGGSDIVIGTSGQGARVLTGLADEARREKAVEQAAVPAEKKPEKAQTGLERFLEERARHAMGHRHELADAFAHALPKTLLVCLPVFALFTRFLFRKSGQFYLQHLVIAVHYHTFIFLWLLFRDGWSAIAGLFSPSLAGWIGFFCTIWIVVYPALMLRRLFANSWPRTLAKMAVLTLGYTVTLGVVFFTTAIILFATL